MPKDADMLVEAGDVLGVRTLRLQGVHAPGELANRIFFRRHPELDGRKLELHETGLVQEWNEILSRIVEPPTPLNRVSQKRSLSSDSVVRSRAASSGRKSAWRSSQSAR